jgi:hypothetical protein
VSLYQSLHPLPLDCAIDLAFNGYVNDAVEGRVMLSPRKGPERDRDPSIFRFEPQRCCPGLDVCKKAMIQYLWCNPQQIGSKVDKDEKWVIQRQEVWKIHVPRGSLHAHAGRSR